MPKSTDAPTTIWRSDRFDSDSAMAAFLATLNAESADRAKIVGMPWGYTIFYPA